ncbi:hypothetical protein OF83DRAFT_1088815 [Amylostereum chailletii]|nr:hypothetical protein OF83DRAFT_1088815 [Amylostereum chailletii]
MSSDSHTSLHSTATPPTDTHTLRHENYPLVTYWDHIDMKDDGKDITTNDKGEDSENVIDSDAEPSRTLFYVQNTHGDMVMKGESSQIHTMFHETLTELLINRGIYSDTWSDVPMAIKYQYFAVMAKEHEELRLCGKYWKANHLATKAYPSFIGNRNSKKGSGKYSSPKEEGPVSRAECPARRQPHASRPLATHPPAASCTPRALACPPAPRSLARPHHARSPARTTSARSHTRSRTRWPALALTRTAPARVHAPGGTLAHPDAPVHHHAVSTVTACCSGHVARFPGQPHVTRATRGGRRDAAVGRGSRRRAWGRGQRGRGGGASVGVGEGPAWARGRGQQREKEKKGRGDSLGRAQHVGVERALLSAWLALKAVVSLLRVSLDVGGDSDVAAWGEGDGGRKEKRDLAYLPNWERVSAVPESRHLLRLELIERSSVHSSPSSSDKG